MKKDRTNTLLDDVPFKYGDVEIKDSIWVPFEVFVEAIRQYFDDGLVTIDGTDNAIWNRFVDLEMIDKFEDNEDFMDVVKQVYMESSYYEEDLEDVIDDYEYDHDLGKYASKDED